MRYLTTYVYLSKISVAVAINKNKFMRAEKLKENVVKEMEEKILTKIESKIIPISIEFEELPVYNPKYTWREVKLYIGLKIKKYKKNNSEKFYLTGLKEHTVRFRGEVISGVAPIGAILSIYYTSGSSKHTYHKISAFFQVIEGTESEVVLKDTKEDKNVKAKVKNLKLIDKLTEQQIVEIEAEIRNKGWLPSQYDPICTLYHYFIKAKKRPKEKEEPLTLTFTIKTIEDIDKAVEKLNELKEAMLKTPERIQSLLKSLT